MLPERLILVICYFYAFGYARIKYLWLALGILSVVNTSISLIVTANISKKSVPRKKSSNAEIYTMLRSTKIDGSIQVIIFFGLWIYSWVGVAY